MLGRKYNIICITCYFLGRDDPCLGSPTCRDRQPHVDRGGSWDVGANGQRATYRDKYDPWARLSILGFRVQL
jgi:formylglycine-generating enzyme required for sulfatase activity